jgi:DNA-directed RNA polymerase subunit RPC12/RpoP
VPFCPRCKFEYEDSVTVCPDCDLRLVTKLREPDRESPLEYGELVYRAADQATAIGARAYLEQHGIHAEIAASQPNLIPISYQRDPVFAPNSYQGEILVLAEDADRARELLRSFEEQSKE